MKAEAFYNFLLEKFGEVTLIEAVNTFYRFKIGQGVKLSAVFGAIEPNVPFGLTAARDSGHFPILGQADHHRADLHQLCQPEAREAR